MPYALVEDSGEFELASGHADNGQLCGVNEHTFQPTYKDNSFVYIPALAATMAIASANAPARHRQLHARVPACG